MSDVQPTAQQVGEAIERWGREDERTKTLIYARMDALIAAAQGQESRWWWLSFVDTDVEPHRFLGLALVKASGYMTAVGFTRWLGINPGGEIAGFPIRPEVGDPPLEYQHTLLDKATADHLAEHGWGRDE